MVNEGSEKQTLLCPYCWNVFEKKDIDWTTQDQAGQQRSAPPRFQRQNQRFILRLLQLLGLRRTPPPPPPRPGSIETEVLARCPVCKEALPEGYAVNRPLIIGLVGGPSSGKTHYLTALLHRLVDVLDLRPDGCTNFESLGDTRRRYRTEFYIPLFRDHMPFGFTRPLGVDEHNQPLVWEMTIQPSEAVGRSTYTVLFFDASGEQLEDDREHVRHKYLYYADALLLFADPHTMQKVVEWLDLEWPGRTPPFSDGPDGPIHGSPSAAPPPQSHAPDGATGASTVGSEEDAARVRESAEGDGQRGARIRFGGGGGTRRTADNPPPPVTPSQQRAMRFPHEFIQDVKRRYNKVHGRSGDEKISIPVSLIISKADELKYVQSVANRMRELLPSPRLQGDGQENQRTEPYRLIEILETSYEVRDILKEIAPPALLGAIQSFSAVTFHVASATGCSLNQQGVYPHVTPQRVVDPFASALLRLNVIGVPSNREA